jgi:hypothetical protein
VSVWELRQAIESAIPAWVLLIPLGLLLVLGILIAAFNAYVSWLFDGWFR